MDAMKAILTRRSVRDFKPEPISDDDQEDLLRAGMQAPTAKNEQPWHFVVIDDRALLHAIPEFHPYSKMLMDAPLAIMVCSDKTLEKKKKSWILDCSAATQNILLAAHAKGLGAVWLGLYPDKNRMDGMFTLLDLPKHIRPVTLIAIGHPASMPEPKDRFKGERVHRNGW